MNFRRSTIALLHGAAMAGACGVAAAADIAIAQKGTVFAFSEVKLGIMPATISPYIINAIGPRWTRALFVTGERFDAEVAARIGLIHHVVEDETAMDKLVEHYAEHVYAASPAAIADTKALVRTCTGESIDAQPRPPDRQAPRPSPRQPAGQGRPRRLPRKAQAELGRDSPERARRNGRNPTG